MTETRSGRLPAPSPTIFLGTISPFPSAGLDQLDELLFRRTYLPASVTAEVIEENQRSTEDQLIAAKFAHPGPPACATMLGLLTVGKSPTDWIPCAKLDSTVRAPCANAS